MMAPRIRTRVAGWGVRTCTLEDAPSSHGNHLLSQGTFSIGLSSRPGYPGVRFRFYKGTRGVAHTRDCPLVRGMRETAST